MSPLVSFFVILQISCAFAMKIVAREKESNEIFWFIIGLVLGPLAFFAIPFMGKKS